MSGRLEAMSNWTEEAADTLPGEWTMKALELYYTPALILIGTAGNILSLVVIRSSVQLRRLSASVYLCGLAVSDTFFLATLLVPWFSFIQEEFGSQVPSDGSRNESNASSFLPLYSVVACPIMVYLTYVSTFLSAWLVLAFTAERFVAVRYPLKRASICTTRRARLILIILTLISLTAFIPTLILARAQEFRPPTLEELQAPISQELQSVPTEEQVFWSTDTTPLEDVSTTPPVLPPSAVVCSLDRRYEWVGTVFNSVDTVLAFLVPCLGIAALNFGIVASMREVGRRRAGVKIRRRSSNNRHLGGNGVVSSFRSEATSCQALCDGPRRQQPVGRRRRPHAKITGMLLVVSTVFVALNLPSYVIRAIIFFEESRATDDEQRRVSTRPLIIPQHAAHLLFNTNFGINFALYCVFGRNFRRALRSFCYRKLVCSRCRSFRERSGRGAAVSGVRRSATGSERVTSTVVSDFSRSCRRSDVGNGNSPWDNGAVEMESLTIH